MNTKSIQPETIIAGFTILMIFILFVFLQMSDKELENTFIYINSISAGASAILITLIFGLSYTFGSLSHRIGSDLSHLYNIIRGRQNQQYKIPLGDEIVKQEYFNKWVVKSFYRTLMLSSPFILIESILLDNRLSNGQHCSTILWIGIILEIVFIIAFVTQNKDVK